MNIDNWKRWNLANSVKINEKPRKETKENESELAKFFERIENKITEKETWRKENLKIENETINDENNKSNRKENKGKEVDDKEKVSFFTAIF